MILALGFGIVVIIIIILVSHPIKDRMEQFEDQQAAEKAKSAEKILWQGRSLSIRQSLSIFSDTVKIILMSVACI